MRRRSRAAAARAPAPLSRERRRSAPKSTSVRGLLAGRAAGGRRPWRGPRSEAVSTSGVRARRAAPPRHRGAASCTKPSPQRHGAAARRAAAAEAGEAAGPDDRQHRRRRPLEERAPRRRGGAARERRRRPAHVGSARGGGRRSALRLSRAPSSPLVDRQRVEELRARSSVGASSGTSRSSRCQCTSTAATRPRRGPPLHRPGAAPPPSACSPRRCPEFGARNAPALVVVPASALPGWIAGSRAGRPS